jgi:hypothetical protein
LRKHCVLLLRVYRLFELRARCVTCVVAGVSPAVVAGVSFFVEGLHGGFGGGAARSGAYSRCWVFSEPCLQHVAARSVAIGCKTRPQSAHQWVHSRTLQSPTANSHMFQHPCNYSETVAMQGPTKPAKAHAFEGMTTRPLSAKATTSRTDLE